MQCHRCGGLMLVDHYDDLHDYSRDTEVAGWRCVNCGAVQDPVIAGNRRATTTDHASPQLVKLCTEATVA